MELETVHQLKKNLEQLNITLLIYQDKPEDIIPELVKQFNIDHIFLQNEWTSEENHVIQEVQKRVSETVAIHKTFDQFLFHPEDVPFDSYDQIPQVFTVFRKKCEKHTLVRPCFDKPAPKPTDNKVELNTEIPTLETLGFSSFETDHRSAFPFEGGENSALQRLQHYFWDSKKLAFYKKTRNGLVGTDYSSKLSPWLANGSISARTIYWEVKRANMIELKQTGWMSNRGRQNVASYWSKHLQQDWRIGASYFEAMLLDYDVHSNWGNWMYNSGVGNDPRNRTFNTQRQAERYDPNKNFQNLWLQPTLF